MSNHERPVSRYVLEGARIRSRRYLFLNDDLFLDLDSLHDGLALDDDLFLHLNRDRHFDGHLFLDNYSLDNRFGSPTSRQGR